MSYLVYARKYRPQTFEDVVAQEHITKTLQNSIKNDRVGSSYLFCGPRGTGKTTTARILAKCLNCINGPTPEPCGECPACIEIAAGSSLDVLEIDAASNTGVDDIRQLRENVRYMPTSGNKRIYIIDEVHRLSGAAFDALLKTLEEPPPHVIFIFATTEPAKVPETILSRTQKFDFKRVSADDLANHLANIAKKDSVELSTNAAKLLGRKADGSVRDSLSLLDQITAYSGTKIKEQDVIDGLGLVDRQLLFDFTAAVASKNNIEVLKYTNNIFSSGVDVSDFVNELLEHFRVLLILSTDKSTADQLNLTEQELKQYFEQADFFSTGDILRLMKTMADLNRDLKSGLNERLLIEMTAVKMAQMESTILLKDIINKLNSGEVASNSSDLFNLSEKKKSIADQSSSNTSTDRLKLVNKSTQNREPALHEKQLFDNHINIPILKQGWNKFIQTLRGKRPMLASQMNMAEIKEVKDNHILFSFNGAENASKQLVEKSENLNIIKSTIRDHYKAEVSISFKIDMEKKPSVQEKEGDGNNIKISELLEKSPRIKDLIEKVDGEILGVKKIK
ncbi:MAG: DNA polymerase III subunit gamma/tau [candidate division Zixibacteria bacterium]|nr:DNA polymerase III subunit gamma/tau [candidate division Zixibacteria bacterium]